MIDSVEEQVGQRARERVAISDLKQAQIPAASWELGGSVQPVSLFLAGFDDRTHNQLNILNR